jgi:hypothetical protein
LARKLDPYFNSDKVASESFGSEHLRVKSFGEDSGM